MSGIGYAETVKSLREEVFGALPSNLKLAFAPVPTHPSQMPPQPQQAAPPVDPNAAAAMQQGGAPPPVDPASAAAAGAPPAQPNPVDAGTAQGAHPELLAIVETLTNKLEVAGQKLGDLEKEVGDLRKGQVSREAVARESFRPGE